MYKRQEYSYTLVKEDVGYYLMAAVAPKHLRCVPGKEQIVVSNSPIKKGQVNIAHIFETDFQDVYKRQPYNLVQLQHGLVLILAHTANINSG